jgi:hypothetical protein
MKYGQESASFSFHNQRYFFSFGQSAETLSQIFDDLFLQVLAFDAPTPRS